MIAFTNPLQIYCFFLRYARERGFFVPNVFRFAASWLPFSLCFVVLLAFILIRISFLAPMGTIITHCGRHNRVSSPSCHPPFTPATLRNHLHPPSSKICTPSIYSQKRDKIYHLVCYFFHFFAFCGQRTDYKDYDFTCSLLRDCGSGRAFGSWKYPLRRL